MRTQKLSITRVGNSRGIRIPAATLKRYQVGDAVIMEERPGEIVMLPRQKKSKLSWRDTFAEMAAEREDWTAWESVSADGL